MKESTTLSLLAVFSIIFIFASKTTLATLIEESSKVPESSPVTLDVTVQDSIIDLDMKGPLKMFLGFSGFPKTNQEQNVWKNYRTQWEEHFEKNVSLMESTHCDVLEASAEINIDYDEYSNAGQYKTPASDMVSHLQLSCDSSLEGKTLKLNFLKAMSRIHSISVNLTSSSGKNESMEIYREDASLGL